MQRKSTFEDFEELMEDYQPKRPRIPANGSELFEENEDYEDVKETADAGDDGLNLAELDEPMVFEEVGPKKNELSAEERLRQREAHLHKQAARRRQNKHTKGKVMAVVQLVLSITIMALLFAMNVLPTKYFVALGTLLFALVFLCFGLQFRPKAHWLGKAISAILCIALFIGNIYVARTWGTLNTVTQVKNYQIDRIIIAVMADDPAETIDDMEDYKFGIMAGLDRTKVDQAIEEINEGLQTRLDTYEYTSYNDLVEDLYSGTVDAMIYNQTLDELIEENNPGFVEKIKVIDDLEVKTEILMKDVPDLPITKEPFVLYLSGMDVYGELEQTSRSDVNIMACVNPVSKQVLLVSVPRDAYVPIPGITDGAYDKLTHAGMYGIQYSMAAMEDIFDLEIDYYVRVNFTALINMVDALGGIDVESDYAFSTYYKQYDEATDTWCYYEYKKGMNHLDGVYALAFARERMNAAGGDYQRARNQQKVIAALLGKIKSPAVLTGYADLLASLEGTMDTSLSSQQIASLVKMQLNDGAEWNIVSSSVYGYASDEYCASYGGSPLSVEILDDDSILAIQEVIDQLMAGEVISEPRVTDLQEAYEVDESDLEGDYYVNNHASDYEYDDFYWEHGGYLIDAENKLYEETGDMESETDEYGY